MKRFLTICIVLALAVLFASPVFAEISEKHFLETHVIATSAANGVTTAVATTTIIPGKHFIVGYSICPDGSTSCEEIIGLYDSTLALASTTTLFAESEAETDESLTFWYPYPKKIATQLIVAQGANTIATIYYVRLIP